MLVEDFLTGRWAHSAGRTYNKSLSFVTGFFKWHVDRGNMLRNPTATIEKANPGAYQRTTFTDEEVLRIFHANPGDREQIALRLLLFYGIRKGALQGIRVGDFDEATGRLTIFTKGQKYQRIPLPADDPIWDLLARLGEPDQHFLIPKQKTYRRQAPHRKQLDRLRDLLEETIAVGGEIDDEQCAFEIAELGQIIDVAADALRRAEISATTRVERFPEERILEHNLHDEWYRYLYRAGIVAKGVRSGRRLHSARHTAAQRVLDRTGSTRAVQNLLGHAHAGVTEVYLGPNEEQLRADLATAFAPRLEDDLQRLIARTGSRVT
jgi:integrase